MADTNIMSAIRDAANDIRLLRISYRPQSGFATQREVEPYEIKDGALYAWDVQRGAIRQFKLDGIQEAVELTESFEPKFPIKI